MAYLGEGFKQLANLANCTQGNQQPFSSCEGKSTALRGEVRFRARF